ncbi:MAG: hypothetical protein AAF539_11820 [Planctomycetota bacterium]
MDATTEPIIAVIGDPIGGNPTQFALETALHHQGIDARVLSFQIPESRIAMAVDGMAALGFRGVWVDRSLNKAVTLQLKPTANQSRPVNSNSDEPVAARARDSESFAADSTNDNLMSGWTDCLVWQPSEQATAVGSWLPIMLRHNAWADLARDALAKLSSTPTGYLLLSDSLASKTTEMTIANVPVRFATTVTAADMESDLEQVNVLVCLDDDNESLMTTARTVQQQIETRHLIVMDASPKLESFPSSINDDSDCVDRLSIHAQCLRTALHHWLDVDVPIMILRDAIEEYLAV